LVVIFMAKEAREQLLKHGVVVTCRGARRSHVGNDWATDKRGGSKLCDVYIEYLGVIKKAEDLRQWWRQSGFASANEWITKVKQMYGKQSSDKKDLNQLHLYRVSRY